MDSNVTNFHGVGRLTSGGGCLLIALLNKKTNNTVYFYMYHQTGKRYVSKGETKSKTGKAEKQEWTFSKTWKKDGIPVEIQVLTEEQLKFAINLAEEIERNPFFEYNTNDDQLRRQYFATPKEKKY